MLYSSAGFLALIISLIINNDILQNRSEDKYDPTRRVYRWFLIALNIYFIADILWGILYERRLMVPVFLDTFLYYLTMACTLLFWTMYAVSYLQEKKTAFRTILLGANWLLFVYQIFTLIINFFHPVVFTFDSSGVYHMEFLRYITLALQIIMFALTAVYALSFIDRSKGFRRRRYITIAAAGIAMGGFLGVQVIYPLLPVYAIVCMLVTCVLHSFVLENEKKEYRDTLEERLADSILEGNYYDPLTGMTNMTHFFETAEKQREEMRKNGGKPAFLFFDLSGLKFYNQKQGLSEGDRALREFSQLLRSYYGENRCSRFGSDHFAVFTEEKNLEETLNKFFREWTLRDSDFPAIRVGIYLDREAGTDISTACDRAKAARDALHSSYVSAYRYFDDTMLKKAEFSQHIISHLDKAMEEGWIEVYYQPIVRAINGRVCDEEALARWNDPERGFLAPDQFIPVLEEARLIYKLDLYVLECILKKIRQIEDAGLHIVPQSINLSRTDFDCCDIVEEIRSRVDAAGIPHHLLSIEITESTIGSDFDFIKNEIERFRSMSFPVWMDDFGSGYSTLDLLSDLPVDLIKLDMRFMQKFGENDRSRIILTELMKMSIALGIDTVCEGVETKEQMEFLRDIGCAKLQGYYYTRPIPLSEILSRYEQGIQIGFENPAESGYFDSVSRINLYDIGILTHEDANPQHRFFRTIPMAIIELRGEEIRFSRSNQAYRDFIRRSFGIELGKQSDVFNDVQYIQNSDFTKSVQRIAEDGGVSFLDETMPDGSVIHSFIRRVAQDPVTGTTALVAAVLSVTPPHSETPLSVLSSDETRQLNLEQIREASEQK